MRHLIELMKKPRETEFRGAFRMVRPEGFEPPAY